MFEVLSTSRPLRSRLLTCMLLALPLAYFALAYRYLASWHREILLWDTLIRESSRAAPLALIFIGFAVLMLLAAFVASVEIAGLDRIFDYARQRVERDGVLSNGGNWDRRPHLIVATVPGEYDPCNMSLPGYKLTKFFCGRVFGAEKSAIRNHL